MRCNLQKFNISRIVALCFAFVLLFACAFTAGAEEIGGSCGDGLTWSLEGGTLTITGSGDMTDFYETDMSPWYEYREDIVRVSLPDGLSSVGELAFYDCNNLTTVIIPDTVESIGDYAFTKCEEMLMLDLGDGVQNIGEAAFSDCYELRSLNLPDELTSIGLKAFYRCESLTTVTIPAKVESIDASAFGYCMSLVSADIQASIDTLPEFMFYGCEKLTTVTIPDEISDIGDYSFGDCDRLGTVYYDGDGKTPEEVKEIIAVGATGFDSTGVVSGETPSSSATSGSYYDNGDGTVTQENTTVTQGENSSVSTTVTHVHPENTTLDGTYSAEIAVNINSDEGWQEAQSLLANTLKDVNDRYTVDAVSPGVKLNVYVSGTDNVDKGFVDSVAGKDMQATIVTRNGSTWKMDLSEVGGEEKPESYNFSFGISPASQETCTELEAATAFELRFIGSTEINAEVLIYLGKAYARQNATLFSRASGKLTTHQTAVVDTKGYAHYYLAEVNSDAEYYIGMNPASVKNEEAIVPEVMLEEYNAISYEPLQYEITGRTSSWGMNINQVTWILIGFMVICVTAVGFTMFFLNKRKLKNGYVPDMYDEE